MNIAEIKQIPISDFLSRLGINPVRASGAEQFYHSPIAADTNPSFVVNDRKGYWNDFGRDQGGTIIDLGLQLFKTNSVSDVVKKFNEIYDGVSIKVQVPEPVASQSANSVRIHLVQDLGKNPALTKYLDSRRLFDAISEDNRLKEVYYDVNKPDGSYKRYFGVGWKNQSGGWEISSAYGKLCVGKKDLTVIDGVVQSNSFGYITETARQQLHKVNIFEGMFDYQAALKLKWIGKEENAIILNSTSLVDKAIEYMKEKNLSANLFLDNDRSGDDATNKIQAHVESVDFRHTYASHNDVNDFLLSQAQLKR